MKKKRKLTVRQRKAVAALANGARSQTEALRQAGYADPNAQVARVFGSATVKAEVEEMLAEEKIRNKDLARVFKDGLKATVVTTFEGTAVKTKAPDYGTRVDTAKHITKLKGWCRDDKDAAAIMQTAVALFAPMLMKCLPHVPDNVREEIAEELEKIRNVAGRAG